MDSTAKVALITGAARGIGNRIARVLAARGYVIYLTDIGGVEEAESTVADIAASGGTARFFKLDIGDSAAVAAFFQDEIKDKVNLALLVNNAGITRDGLVIRMKDEDWDMVQNVNLRGAFVCLREAAKIMTRQRHGRIINIASVSGQMGNAGQANYSAAKAGMIGLTKSAAKELGVRNITVNAVAPGFIETAMTAALSDDVQKQYLEHIPLRRFGSADDVAAAVAFLASDEAGYITGQVLAVNGGLYC